MAPEFFNKKLYTKVTLAPIIKQIDIWSCGIIMYQLITLELHPFHTNGESIEEYCEKMRNYELKLTLDKF